MTKNADKTAREILAIIKPENVISYTNCLTRLRLNLNLNANINLNLIKSLPNIMGVITPTPGEIQIILGPGFVTKVAVEFAKILNLNNNLNQYPKQQANTSVAINFKSQLKQKQNFIQNFFTRFSKIFSPMIIGFIGAGILAGIAGIIQSIYGGAINETTAPNVVISWFNLLNLILNIWKNAFIIIVGWRTAEIFGGSGVIGAMIATIYAPVFANYLLPIIIINNNDLSVNILGITIYNPLSNWLTVGFRPINENNKLIFSYPSGNILGVLLTVTAGIWIEKGIRKFMPDNLDTIFTPTVTLFILLLINIFLIIPISGYLYEAIAWVFAHLYTNPFGAFILAGIFLFAVSFGIHQGFIPIYAILINTTGINGLFPILAMSGMSQVGTGIALWILAEKKSLLRKQIQGALIPAIFGIGEPMIYGVTLPRIKPFITASIGAAFGGFFIGSILMWTNISFGLNAMFGPSGILATFMMTTKNGAIILAAAMYLISCFIAIIAGCLITLFSYSTMAKIGIYEMKQLYINKNKDKIYQKVLWSLMFITLIGIFIFWTLKYYQLPQNQKLKFKQTKVE